MNCKYYGNCNACTNLELAYEGTLDLKIREFNNILSTNNIFPDNFNSVEIIASPKPYNYRTRCQLHIEDGKIGFHKRKTNELVEIETCILLDEKINDKIKTLKFPKNFNGKIELYIKNSIVYEALIEKKYANNFSQVNSEVNDILKAKVLEFLDLKKFDTVLELYCGAGNFTFDIARQTFVNAIDTSVPTGKFKNIDFIEAEINNNFQNFTRYDFNKLLLDPPRKGLTFTKLEKLFSNNFEKIVYVSCNPNTLVIDAEKFNNFGYKWKNSTLLDMFPYTEHIESVNVFFKNNVNI